MRTDGERWSTEHLRMIKKCIQRLLSGSACCLSRKEHMQGTQWAVFSGASVTEAGLRPQAVVEDGRRSNSVQLHSRIHRRGLETR